MPGRREAALTVAFGMFLGLATALAGQAPSLTREQMREFLLTAEVVASERIGTGVTQPWRLTLSDGTITHDAAFQSVDERRQVQRLGATRELNFVDSYRYNIAAYRLAELLGLEHMMPVTVERRWRSRRGALSWWLDDVLFDETTRVAERRWPEDMARWNAQMYRMILFAELVYDTDRNLGNILYTEGWKLQMIDFTRAFRIWGEVRRPAELVKCDRDLFERLPTLTQATVAEATQPYLTGGEIQALLERRDAIVDHFARLIAERGEALVLY